MNQQPQTMEPEIAGQRALFDYGALDQETQVLVRLRASAIKGLAKRVAGDIAESGGKLAEVKDRVGGNGKFNEWLSSELGWSERTAYNFIAVWQKFGAANFALENVATSALYLLAAPSTPAEAVEVARQLADSGEDVTHSVAKEIVRQAKDRKPKQEELIEEPEETAEEEAEEDRAEEAPSTAEEPRRPMDELVATVKRFSGRIMGSTLTNQGFTIGQVIEALDRKLIEKRDSGYLWYVEPAPGAEVAPAVESARKQAPVEKPSADLPAAWYKTRVEITITLMPGPEPRKIMHSVRTGDSAQDIPFVAVSSGERELLEVLPPITRGLFEKAAAAFAKKPTLAKKPTAKSKPAPKKLAAKSKAKGGKK